jgi:hypothetical protein
VDQLRAIWINTTVPSDRTEWIDAADLSDQPRHEPCFHHLLKQLAKAVFLVADRFD